MPDERDQFNRSEHGPIKLYGDCLGDNSRQIIYSRAPLANNKELHLPREFPLIYRLFAVNATANGKNISPVSSVYSLGAPVSWLKILGGSCLAQLQFPIPLLPMKPGCACRASKAVPVESLA